MASDLRDRTRTSHFVQRTIALDEIEGTSKQVRSTLLGDTTMSRYMTPAFVLHPPFRQVHIDGSLR